MVLKATYDGYESKNYRNNPMLIYSAEIITIIIKSLWRFSYKDMNGKKEVNRGRGVGFGVALN